jgi:hypothetical protein
MHESRYWRTYDPGRSQPPAFGIPTVRVQGFYSGVQRRLIASNFIVGQVERKFDISVPLANTDRTAKKGGYRFVLVV